MIDVVPLDAVASDCFEHFGFQRFNDKRIADDDRSQCPVDDCRSPLIPVKYGKVETPRGRYCPVHGLRLHKTTFVYWNGPARSVEGRLRNFDILPELARKLMSVDNGKVETHRLGHEMSEDALSWNVFVGLAAAGKLRETVSYLTDAEISSEPELYLWGERINLDGTRGKPFGPLLEARGTFERYGGKFKTEPDVILHVPGEIVICVEAKFGSSNPLSGPGLLARYLPEAALEMNSIFDRHKIDEKKVHSQLFRNLVFAATMAKGNEWRVVNLACAAGGVRKSAKPPGSAPEGDIREYLKGDHQHRFTFRTWEGLHQAVIRSDSALQRVDSYIRSKSAHFRPAFHLAQEAEIQHKES